MSFEVDVHIALGKQKIKFSLDFKASFEIGKTNIVYGNSGAGKTTVLRTIAGLETSDKGSIIFNNVAWFDAKNQVNKPVMERPVGMLFQEANLFPNMTVKGNLEYALGRPLTAEISELCELCELTELLNSMPATLSGGQKQRASLIRSFCQNPEVLLLDEPFSALDDEAVTKMIQALKMIQMRYNTTYILATHRKEVGNRIADKIITI